MSKRGRAGILAVLVAAAGAVVWWLAHGPSDEAAKVPRGEPVARASATALARTDPDVPLAWMLEPGMAPRRIAGVVRRDGVPVADAVVRLGSVRMSVADLPQPEDRTDANGGFDFGAQPIGWYRVLAHVAPDEYAREVVDLREAGRNPPADQLVLEVEACEQWTWGRVVDAGGGSVQGARVSRITRIPGGTWVLDHFVTTDAEGSFRLCGGGRHEVTISADAYGTVRLPRGNPPDGHLVMLVPEAQLAGVVVDERGAPIADAVLTLDEEGARHRTQMGQHALSDATGRFHFRGVEPGRYQIVADAGGHLTLETENEYYLDVGDVRDDAVVLMRRCPRTVAGHVLRGAEPVAGASLSFDGMGSGFYTQEDGSFVLRCDDGTGFEIEVVGHDVVEPRRIPDGEKDILDIVVRVERRAEIRGRVTAEGAPVSGAVVELRDPERDAFRSMSGAAIRARTSEQGQYVLTGVPAGMQTLRAHDATTGWRSAPRDVEVAGRAPVAGVDLALRPAPAITGVVRDEGGAAVVDVIVRALPQTRRRRTRTGRTDAEGRFRLVGVERGAYRVGVDGRFEPATAEEWPVVEVVDDHGATTVDVVARTVAWGSISGRVEYRDGLPAAYAHVNQWESETMTDLAGRFTLRDVQPGEHEIRVTAPDGAVWNGTASPGDEELVIVLARSGRIVGTVGGAGPRWYVQTKDKKHSGKWSAEVRDGRFEVEAIPPGDYRLQLFPPPTGYGGLSGSSRAAEAAATITVLPGQTTTVPLVAESDRGGSGTIVGRALYYPGGEVATGLRCSAAGRTALVDDAGRFEIADVTSGNLIVDCRSPTIPSTREMTAGEVRTSVGDGSVVEVTVHIVGIDFERMGELGARLMRAPDSARAAASFTAIEPDGAAAAAGIGEGDVLVTVDGAPAQGEHRGAATTYLSTRPAGRNVTLRVRRPGDGGTLELAVIPKP